MNNLSTFAFTNQNGTQRYAFVRNDHGDVVRGDALSTPQGQAQAKAYPELN